VLVSVTGQILALSGLAIIGLLINRAIKLELTLACLLTGFLAGVALGTVKFDTGIRAHNLQELVFFIILPVLIFEAAWHLKPHLLQRWLGPVLILATLGVLISCFITAGLVFLGVGHPQGFPWLAALLTGAILAATDPIAVIAQLRSQNAPENLTTLFEGESLFNDASAVVLFAIVLSFATETGGSQESSYLQFFATVFFGGMFTGLLIGLVSTAVVLVIGKPASTAFVLVFTAFGSFYIAEHLLHVSGIMAVMASAVIIRFFLSEVEATVAEGVGFTWDWLGLFFNSVLFVIMGLVISVDMFQERWLAMLIAIAAALVARGIAVVICGLLTRPLTNTIPMGWQILLTWGGLRGAIAIALVLSLPVELPYWWTVQSMVFGVVLFSLLVQGTTNKALIKRFSGS
jgi:CPA1 family monovalent cation:H+ antiporter